jgi:hypothetical protein
VLSFPATAADNANELPIGAMRIELNSMVGGGNYPTNLTVLLYDDEVDSWPAVSATTLSTSDLTLTFALTPFLFCAR